ncbi:alpha/beta hydrolase [Pelagibacteraceae bacterium]|nr:alpha/beta hydrolase [Pelagibacteraceae bacterium]
MSNKVDLLGTSYSLNSVNEKNPIVFVHGVGLTKEIWEPQIFFFKDYNTLTYDLLGHGKTPLKKSKVSFEDFSKQLVKLIDGLSFSKIHLVGFSFGALIARHFASEHSDRLSSLIMHGSIYKRTEEQRRVVKNRFEVAKMDKPVSKHTALRRWLSDDFSKKNPDIYKKIYSILEKNNRLDFLKCYEIFVNYMDDNNMIKKINVDTLITAGENDVGSTPEMSRNLSKIIQRSKFIEIKKGKHLCSIECADNVNITFKEFIDQHND